MINKKYYLVINWFIKIIKNHFNSEILLIIEDEKQEKNTLIKKLEKNYKTYNLRIFNINEIKSINHIKESNPQTNLLLVGSSFMDIQKIHNLDYTILHSNYSYIKLWSKNFFHNSNLILDKKKLIDSKYYEITFDKKINSYLFYIEKKDPIEIINSKNFNYIYNNTLYLFVQAKYDIFKNKKELQSNKKDDYVVFEKHIEKDINYFLKKEILTSRLAIAIFRSSTLDLLATNTKIGNFFSKSFGTKSKTHRLYKETFKAYDLKSFYESTK